MALIELISADLLSGALLEIVERSRPRLRFGSETVWHRHSCLCVHCIGKKARAHKSR